jgi:hypothetical protein
VKENIKGKRKSEGGKERSRIKRRKQGSEK